MLEDTVLQPNPAVPLFTDTALGLLARWFCFAGYCCNTLLRVRDRRDSQQSYLPCYVATLLYPASDETPGLAYGPTLYSP